VGQPSLQATVRIRSISGCRCWLATVSQPLDDTKLQYQALQGDDNTALKNIISQASFTSLANVNVDKILENKVIFTPH